MNRVNSRSTPSQAMPIIAARSFRVECFCRGLVSRRSKRCVFLISRVSPFSAWLRMRSRWRSNFSLAQAADVAGNGDHTDQHVE